MMFTEAKCIVNRPRPVFNGLEYEGTSVGQMLKLIHVLHGPGDSYDVEYREMVENGHVKTRVGLASYEWILARAFTPGVELTKVKPSEVTMSRWCSMDQWRHQ
ncbi:hypothetical protein [Aeromonas phage L9-6]|nr:hypothetical protein [Aeromonas phage L9-6]